MKKLYVYILLVFAYSFFASPGFSQQVEDSLQTIPINQISYQKTCLDSIRVPYDLASVSKKKKKIKLVPLPIVLVTPETDLVLGVALQGYFKIGTDPKTYTSNSSTNIQYTTRKQLISWTKWDLFLKGNALRFNGELKYQKYPNKYWGIGYNTPNANETNYSYQQVLFNFKWLTAIKGTPMFLGISYKLNTQFNIVPIDTPNLLTDVDRPLGYNDFLNNGIGLAAMWDTRDHNIFPYKGVWAQLTAHYFTDRDNFVNEKKNSFFSMQLDVREYFSFFKQLKTPHVIAFQQYLNINSDEVPFDVLSKVGGDLYGRGYFEGRYRDRVMFSLQAEYRLPLFWKLGIAGFAGVSEVAPDFNEFVFNEIKWFAGAGLRFAMFPQDRVNLRVDFGFGRDGSSGVYFKLNEAF